MALGFMNPTLNGNQQPMGQQGGLTVPSGRLQNFGAPVQQTTAVTPWDKAGWVQPTPTYSAVQPGQGAIGSNGQGGPPQPMPVVAGQGSPTGMPAGLDYGQWGPIIQALSGFGSGMYGSSGYANPQFLAALLGGLQ